MKKIALTTLIKKITLGAGLTLMAIPMTYADQAAPAAPQINAKAYVLMDYDSGKILTEANADERLDPASLTKIMASYVIGQSIKAGKITPNDMLVVGKDACATGNPILRGSSLMFLKPGDRVPVSELNKGVVIQSGNDASIALADYVAGSQDAFVSLMNKYVEAWGLKNTSFKTVHGLDSEGQYSSARDMALISQRLIADVPDEYALHKEKEFTFNKIRQVNRNRLLWDSSLNVDGIKTGYTSGAGHNLVSSATDGPMRLISVVLGAPTDRIRFEESKKLLTWGFRFFETVSPLKAGREFASEPVWFGDTDRAQLGVDKDVYLTIPRGRMKDLKASYTLNSTELDAPLAKNQVVGTINFQLDGKTIEQRPLVVLNEVQEGGFFSRMIDHIKLMFHRWFG